MSRQFTIGHILIGFKGKSHLLITFLMPIYSQNISQWLHSSYFHVRNIKKQFKNDTFFKDFTCENVLLREYENGKILVNSRFVSYNPFDVSNDLLFYFVENIVISEHFEK